MSFKNKNNVLAESIIGCTAFKVTLIINGMRTFVQKDNPLKFVCCLIGLLYFYSLTLIDYVKHNFSFKSKAVYFRVDNNKIKCVRYEFIRYNYLLNDHQINTKSITMDGYKI